MIWELGTTWGLFWFCCSTGKIWRQIVDTASAFINYYLSMVCCNTGVIKAGDMGDVLIAWTCVPARPETEWRAPSITRCLQERVGMQTPVGQNCLLRHNSSTYFPFTFMENKDTLCLFDSFSKVIYIGSIIVRAPENPSHVPWVGHSPLHRSAKPLSALHLNLRRRFCKPYKEGVFYSLVLVFCVSSWYIE